MRRVERYVACYVRDYAMYPLLIGPRRPGSRPRGGQGGGPNLQATYASHVRLKPAGPEKKRPNSERFPEHRGIRTKSIVTRREQYREHVNSINTSYSPTSYGLPSIRIHSFPCRDLKKRKGKKRNAKCIEWLGPIATRTVTHYAHSRRSKQTIDSTSILIKAAGLSTFSHSMETWNSILTMLVRAQLLQMLDDEVQAGREEKENDGSTRSPFSSHRLSRQLGVWP